MNFLLLTFLSSAAALIDDTRLAHELRDETPFSRYASFPPLLLDGAAAHHVYDGIGGLSAGASSRLLIDYPEPQRSDMLDLLFLPSHGASLQILKIEIGGDVMSTDGTEPSHAHFRGDLSCDRGYELWLASEALKRNPAIATFALSWGVPGWVGNGSFFSAENMAYQAQFATCFKEKVGVPLSYTGVWNERSWVRRSLCACVAPRAHHPPPRFFIAPLNQPPTLPPTGLHGLHCGPARRARRCGPREHAHRAPRQQGCW